MWGAGCAVVAVAHEMARIMYFMLVREEPYWDENRGLTERKLKNVGKKAYDGLRNQVDAIRTSEFLKIFS